jgi:LPXTG-site transpeptidase (sortase) family protein
MTAVDSRSVTTGTAAAPRMDSPARPATGRAMPRVLRIAVISLLLGLVAATVFQLFEGPVARAWYTTRQHQLAAQFAATRPHTGKGAAIALLQVPSLGTNLVVAEGDSPQQLRSGPGHRIGTPLPGEKGNSVIVGHRTGWGGSLTDVGQLKPGGHIVVQTGSVGGPINVFTVVSVKHIEANDPSPFVNSSDRRLTIVTGTGGRYSDRRLVVTAVSGRVGKVNVPTATVHATTSAGSPVWNGDVLLAVGALGAGAAIGFVLRRRYRVSTIAVVVAPLLVLGVLGCLLSIDAALPALR